jgi:hypothetical protein
MARRGKRSPEDVGGHRCVCCRLIDSRRIGRCRGGAGRPRLTPRRKPRGTAGCVRGVSRRGRGWCASSGISRTGGGSGWCAGGHRAAGGQPRRRRRRLLPGRRRGSRGRSDAPGRGWRRRVLLLLGKRHVAGWARRRFHGSRRHDNVLVIVLARSRRPPAASCSRGSATLGGRLARRRRLSRLVLEPQRLVVGERGLPRRERDAEAQQRRLALLHRPRGRGHLCWRAWGLNAPTQLPAAGSIPWGGGRPGGVWTRSAIQHVRWDRPVRRGRGLRR